MMALEGAVAEESNGATFNAKDWVVAELLRMGVPRQEIAFINDFKTNNAKRRLFNDMNEGKVRILIGHPKHARDWRECPVPAAGDPQP